MTRPTAVDLAAAAAADSATPARGLDQTSAKWLSSLRSTGAQRDGAVAELHALLLRAARFETARRGLQPGRDRDDLATQAAADALMHVLNKLDAFEGRSRFTTWAYKFAIYEAGVKARRRGRARGHGVVAAPRRRERARRGRGGARAPGGAGGRDPHRADSAPAQRAGGAGGHRGADRRAGQRLGRARTEWPRVTPHVAPTHDA